jgi:Raf kinase inhibitor-like YbhB/YbcL family protein
MSKWYTFLVLLCLVALTAASCSPSPEPTEIAEPLPEEESIEEPVEEEIEEPTEIPPTEVPEEEPMDMALTSPVFNEGEAIPVKFSCDGEDISPELDWFGIPEGTVSLALIMDDPDAPVGIWVHWVVYNMPMDLSGLREGMTGVGIDGTNSWNQTGYGGPCPPSGTHRYFFTLYALDINLDLDPGATKEALLAAMEGHILGQAELMGTYSR